MGHLLKLKCALRTLEYACLASTRVPFRPTTVQMPNLALIETKRITVYHISNECLLWISDPISAYCEFLTGCPCIYIRLCTDEASFSFQVICSSLCSYVESVVISACTILLYTVRLSDLSCLFCCPMICLSVLLSVFLSIYLSFCPFVCLSVLLSVFLAFLSFHLSFRHDISKMT